MNKYEFRTAANKLVRGRLLALHKLMTRHISDEIYGGKVTYNLNSEIGTALYFRGEFEKKELELCKKYISRDSVILDIGANIGLHSIYFSRIAREGLVFSFEPSQETFELLSTNVSSIYNIIPLNIGISDRHCIADFFVASDNAYSSLKDTKRKDIKRRQKILCLKLDDIFMKLNLQHIDFIKIDVEGLEQPVLEGMQDIMNTYYPVIFCEIYQGTNSNKYPEKTIKFIADRGYDVFVFDGDKTIPYEKHDDNYYNYLFIPKDKK